jgi:ketopantoate hydroxymethyltransferase
VSHDPGITRPKVTVRTIREMKTERVKIVSVTATTIPARAWPTRRGGLILVGDSLGMVVRLRVHDPRDLSEMASPEGRGPRSRAILVVADLPFLSFQTSPGTRCAAAA